MNLETLLGSLDTDHLPCYPNRGNAGDGLIQAGLFQLCARLGITLEMIEYPGEKAGRHVLLIGAGCFCPGSSHMVDPVGFYASRFENVYVLPASFETSFGPVEKMLRALPSNVTVFCRERTSYDGVCKLVPKPENIFLDEDLAFHLDISPWKRPGQGELNCFRTDNESRFRRLPRPNFDISKMGREFHHTLLLDLLANFATIHTDRLHVMIAGAMMGKKVCVFDGTYHKNRSVYEHSIRDKYPNVTLGSRAEMKSLLRASDKEFIHYTLARMVLRLPQGEALRRAYKKYRQDHKKEGPLA
jgi:hypothetical protein